MKREELAGLGLNDEQVDAIMKMNGNDINREKSKYADYDDLKAQLEKANATLETFKDYDNVKADVEKYKAEAELARKESAEKLAKIELQTQIKDFTSGKKFVNELTRNAINAELETAVNNPANKGKSFDDLLKAITDGKENIFDEENKPTPPQVVGMNGDPAKENGVVAAFKALNPNLKI